MTITNISQLLESLSEFKKAAHYYDKYRLPFEFTVCNEALSLPSDSWNSGSNHRILIPEGATTRIVTREEAYLLGQYGPDCDQIMGLWVNDFSYGWV